MSAHKGFTLIELLVVIAIIAILSVVGIAAFKGVTGGARDSTRRADIDAIAKAYEIQKTSGYIALSDSQFASGKKPQDPNSQKGDYFNWLATDGSGFKVCASLDSNPSSVCNTPALNCHCKFSSQGTLNPSSPVNQGASTNYTFGLGGSSQQSCDPNGTLLSGLVGYWKMDEGSWTGAAGEVKDSAGSNNGTAAGGANTTPGKFVNAGSFDGIDDYVSMGQNAPDLSEISGNQLTVSAWINPANIAGTKFIAIKNGPFLFYLTDNQLRGAIFTGTWVTTNIGTIQLLPGQWSHVVMTYDGGLSTDNIKLYVNNVLDSGVANNEQTGNFAGNGCVQIGRYNAGACDSSVSDYFNGLIDDVRIYNRALSSQEISSLWSSGNGCVPQ